MYSINYALTTGEVVGIQKGNMSIPICEGNMDFVDFLIWNTKQTKPLDWETPKVIPAPFPRPPTIEERLNKLTNLLIIKEVVTQEDIDSVDV